MYTTVENLFTALPRIGSVTSISSETIFGLFVTPVDALINARLAKLYTVPVSGSPLLEMIARDMATYYVLRRFFTQDKGSRSDWPDRFKQSTELLDQIATGQLALYTTSGTMIEQNASGAGVAWSNTQGYAPTFGDDADDIGAIIDETKQEDIDAARS